MGNTNPPPTNNPPVLPTTLSIKDDPQLEDESVNTPLVSLFIDLDDDFDDGEVLSELEEYVNIITRKAYNTIMVNGLESMGMNLVAIVRNVCVFIGSFTYVTNFVVLEDIGEFILREIAKVVMGKPFREVTNLDYDCGKGLVFFTRTFDNYTFQMPRTIPRFKS
nr:MAK10-like protein [Tanacetum cinerariifolium]